MLCGLYRDLSLVAIVGRRRVWFITRRFRKLPDTHAERHLLTQACGYYRRVQEGTIAGRLRSGDAWRHARETLIPTKALELEPDDFQLARDLVVPVRDIAAARAEREPGNVRGSDRPLRLAPRYLTRMSMIAGLWLTIGFGIQLIAEPTDAAGREAAAPFMFAAGIASLAAGSVGHRRARSRTSGADCTATEHADDAPPLKRRRERS